MKTKKSMTTLRAIFQNLKAKHPDGYADLIIDALVYEDILGEVADRIQHMKQVITEPEGTPSYTVVTKEEPSDDPKESSQVLENNRLPTPPSRADEEEEDTSNSEVPQKRPRVSKNDAVTKQRKNRRTIEDEELNHEDVKEAARKLRTVNLFKAIENMQHFGRYEFTTDTKMLEKYIPKVCRAYLHSTKLAFFAEVARAISATTYYLQMQTLKKIGLRYHTEMLDRIREKNIISMSELNRIKVLGNRLFKLTQMCGLGSLAVLSCISCGRIIECTNEVFDKFVGNAYRYKKLYECIDFHDEFVRQFQVFYERSIEYI